VITTFPLQGEAVLLHANMGRRREQVPRCMRLDGNLSTVLGTATAQSA
jgi:uncharacterized protein Veg